MRLPAIVGEGVVETAGGIEVALGVGLIPGSTVAV